MVTPASYAIALYVAGVNIVAYCPYEAMELDDLRHDPSTFRFVVENASALTIEQNAIVLAYSIETEPVSLIFSGYIVKLRQKKRDNGISVEYEVACEDYKVRLQKSVVPYKLYEGLDTDIIDELFADAYPDLTSLFDLSDLASVADNLSLEMNDDSLLDGLKKLSDLSGADYRFDRDAAGGSLLITFDAGTWGTELGQLADGIGYHLYDGAAPELVSSVTSGGNPDDCAKWLDVGGGTISSGNTVCLFEINLGGVYHVDSISFDYRVSGTSNVELFSDAETQAIAGTDAWHSHTFNPDNDNQFPKIGFRATASLDLDVLTLDLRFDNIRVNTTTPLMEGDAPLDNLVWDSAPDLSNFDLDIDLSDEFGFDFNLDIGGFDDFNSIIIIGGKTEEAIEWTYHSNIYENHLGLELPVKNIGVSVNTNTDAAPIWSVLGVGEWGKDLLFDEGGSSDVLYDSKNHWLIFDSGALPITLERAIKVTGTIERPIRVKVENVSGDEPVYTTTLFDDSITSEDQAAQLGLNELEKRNALRQMSFSTHNPGLKPGQTIHVTDTNRGLDETLIIQRINTTWIGSKNGLFQVECGNAETADASILISNNDYRSRQKAAPSAIGTTSFEAMLDSDGSTLYDSDGTVLYESA